VKFKIAKSCDGIKIIGGSGEEGEGVEKILEEAEQITGGFSSQAPYFYAYANAT